MAHERITLGPLQNPIRGLLDVSAALVSSVLCVMLWTSCHCAPATRVAVMVFAVSQVSLFTASALYHTVPWSARWKQRLQRIDHSMIYVKVAGVLTPVVWLSLEGDSRRILLTAAWGVVALGIAQKAFFPAVTDRVSIGCQLALGMLVLPALGPFAERFPGTPTLLLLLGAGLQLVGLVLFVTERPRMWPRLFSFHELFHVLLIGASGAHWMLVGRWLAGVL